MSYLLFTPVACSSWETEWWLPGQHSNQCITHTSASHTPHHASHHGIYNMLTPVKDSLRSHQLFFKKTKGSFSHLLHFKNYFYISRTLALNITKAIFLNWPIPYFIRKRNENTSPMWNNSMPCTEKMALSWKLFLHIEIFQYSHTMSDSKKLIN